VTAVIPGDAAATDRGVELGEAGLMRATVRDARSAEGVTWETRQATRTS
jgi:hypothetical protein